MKTLIISILLGLFIATSSYARKPAVEEFVGVESKDYSQTSPGTEVLFDFSKKLVPEADKTQSPLLSVITLISLVAFPFLMWGALSSKLKIKTEEIAEEKTVDLDIQMPGSKHFEDENVEYLQNYRDTDKTDHKKAS